MASAIRTSGRLARLASLPFVLLGLLAACGGGGKPRPAPTFTPSPASVTAAAGAAAAPPAHPLVAATCLRGLSSYRFSGSFALQPPAVPSTAAAGGGESPRLSGSLANLLANVTFQGAALAPDRYQARITFGGNGVQPFEIRRIGGQTFSRFGDGAWQPGDQIAGLGAIGQFDPQTFCQNVVASIDAGTQTPVAETVNGIRSQRFELAGPRLSRALGGGRADAAASQPGLRDAKLTVWRADKGGYPVRLQLSGATAAGSIQLSLDVSDVNGKDVRIDPPA